MYHAKHMEEFTNPESKLVIVRFNKRYQNVNAGEIAGYDADEAAKLCNMETDLGGDKFGFVATPVKQEKKASAR